MKVRHAVFLAFLWVVSLLAADVWCALELKVADAHLNLALGELFEAPVSFGNLTLGPTLDVVLSDVRIMRPDDNKKIYGTIDAIKITPRWDELLTRFRLDAKEIAVENPTVVVKWKKDRTFDMPSPLRSDLEARTKISEVPAITLEGLTLVFEDPPDFVKNKREIVVFNQLRITLAPEGSSRWLYRFDVDVEHPLLGHVVGGGNFSKTAFEVHLKHHGLAVSQELVATLRPGIAETLGDLQVDGELTLAAEIGPVRGGTAEALTARLECEDVAVKSRVYALGISGIKGRVDFEDGIIKSSGLTAMFEGAPVQVKGKVDLTGASRVVEVEGQLVNLPVTNALAAKIRKLPDPCPTVADQIEAWDPEGYANVDFHLEKERDAEGKISFHPMFNVEFKGGSKLKYAGHIGDDGHRHGFPYPLEDLRGVLKFTDKAVVFERLTALNGSLAVEARGRIDYEHGGDETYDVDVEARGLKLDARVSEALTGGSRELFDSLDADGSADMTVAVKRKKGEPPGPRVEIAVELQGVALNPKPFPIDFADARGRIVIPDSGPIRIENVTARRGGGSIAMEGSVPVRRGQSGLDIKVRCEKFPIDGRLTAALNELVPAAGQTLAKLNPTGAGTGTVRVAMALDGTLSQLDGAFSFEKMTLAPEDPSLRIEDVEGSVTIAPSTITINEGTTGAIAGEHFAVHGTITEGRGLDLRVEAENFQVDRELLAEIEPMIPWIRGSGTRPEIEGPMSVKLHIAGDPASPAYDFELDCLGVDVALGSIPGFRFDDVRGHCAMTPDGVVTLKDLTTRAPLPAAPVDPANVVVGSVEPPRPAMTLAVATGTWTPAPAGSAKPSKGRLVLGASSLRGLRLSPQTIALLPLGEETRERIAGLVPAGTLDLTLGKLTWDGAEIVLGRSQLVATGLSFGAERTVQIGSATVERLTLKTGEGLFDLDGNFVCRDSRIFDIPIAVMMGKLAADAAGMRFESIEADLFAYEMRDNRRFPLGKINPEDSRLEIGFDDGSFDTRLRLQEVNLPAAIRALGGNPGQVGGVFGSRFELQGTLGDSATYRGGGDLVLRARNVVSLPMFYKMFNSLDVLQIFERSDPWTKVEVNFRVGNKVVEMKPIRIDAPEVLLQGPGTLTFAGMINADLKANQGMGISPIGWVTRLISHVVFAGVRIDGPISDPRVNAYSVAGG